MGRRPRETPAEDASGARLTLLVIAAICTSVTLELVRTIGALLEVGFDIGVEAAAGMALAACVGAAIPGGLLSALGRRRSGYDVLAFGVVALATMRLVAQSQTGDARVIVGLTAIAVALAVLVIAVAVLAEAETGATAAFAVACGGAIAVGLQLALGTWDAYWRHDLVGWAITSASVGVLVAAAARLHRSSLQAPLESLKDFWVLGPLLGLMFMIGANAGFAASQSGVRLAVSGPITAGGLLIAAGAALRAPQTVASRGERSALALAAPLMVAAVFWVDGPGVLVLLVGAQLALLGGVALSLQRRSFESQTGSGHTPVRDGVYVGLAGLGVILPLLVFQFDYDRPLGFPNELVIVAAAAVLSIPLLLPWSGHDEQVPAVSRSKAMLALATVVVLIGSTLAVAREVAREPDPGDLTVDTPIRLVSWNVHYGVGPFASIDLEDMARSIEEQQPSVVALQEVSRGWGLGGGVDMATWLAERLEMEVAYAPAADRQFGNAVLTNLPVGEVRAIELPYGNGPQERSAVSVELLVPAGSVHVASIHLQNQRHVETKLAQIDTFLEAQSDVESLIVAGDFNAEPGEEEIDRMIAAGFESAQDESGDPSAMTSSSLDPYHRIDWVFGRGVEFVTTEVLPEPLESDHLPLSVVFNVRQEP